MSAADNLPFDPDLSGVERARSAIAASTPTDNRPRVFVRVGRACVEIQTPPQITSRAEVQRGRGGASDYEIAHDLAQRIAGFLSAAFAKEPL